MWNNIFTNNTSQGVRCLTYALIILAAIWLTISVYCYFTEEVVESIAAFASYAVCLLLALGSFLWDQYLKKKALKESILGKLVDEGYPMAKTALTKLQNINQVRDILGTKPKSMFILAALCCFFGVKSMLSGKK